MCSEPVLGNAEKFVQKRVVAVDECVTVETTTKRAYIV